jgi:CheY-like chemotaxis protein
VLVVEDDGTLADVLRDVLQEEGFAVALVGEVTPEAVREAVGRTEPDCILLDGGGRAGYDAGYGQSWRDATWAHARPRPVPVIMFTVDARASGEALEATSARSREAAFFAVVPKPFLLDELLAVVERAVGTTAPFDGSPAGESARTAALVAKLAAAGARDVRPSTRREWANFYADAGGMGSESLGMLYWSQRDGVYYVLRQDPPGAEGGTMRQVGRFHDLDQAVAAAVGKVTAAPDAAGAPAAAGSPDAADAATAPPRVPPVIPGGPVGPETGRVAMAAPTRLSGRELVALQLLARGYRPDQIARLHRVVLLDELWDLQRVLAALDASTVGEAVAKAKGRGLIV